MPVKVRCSSCEKVFAAPDAARGKLVKCPGCEGKVKVPAGDGAKSRATAKPAAKKPAPAKKKDEHHDDHEHALKNLDLDNVEDENARICPKCGQEIYEEEVLECPACGLNFETGVTKEKQKGVDPKMFFRVAFKDSKKFLIDHKRLAIRTGIYTVVFSLVNFGCLFMLTWCSNFPPRVFWTGLTFITGMVPSGWLWFLNSEIIKFTMDKKEKLPRINFDMFTCVALGIKYALWRTIMGAQLVLPLVAGFMFYRGMLMPGIALQALSEILLVLMIPQVMIHMVMPITTRGWLMHVQFQAWAKSFGASAYWAGITLIFVLPTLLPAGLALGIFRQGAIQFAADLAFNNQQNSILGADIAEYTDKKNRAAKGVLLVEIKSDDEKYKTRPLPWKGFIVPAIGIMMSQALFGFAAVFAMRMNGLFGLYYKKHLKLESMAKEVKWVAKATKAEDEDPAVIEAKKKQQMIANIVAVVIFLAAAGGVAWYLLRKPGGTAPVPGGEQVPAGAMPAGAPGAAPAGMPGMPGAAPAGMPAMPGAGAAPAGAAVPGP